MAEHIDFNKNAVIAIILVSTFIGGLDAVMVSMALPSISRDMGAGLSMSTLVQNGYVLGSVGFLLYFAKIADSGRMKITVMAGLVVFAATTILCSVSPSVEFLALMRFLQGIGGAMISCIAPVLVIRVLPADMKGRGMGYISVAAGAGAIVGAPLSGVIASAVGWRWLFIINVPVCLLLLYLVLRYLPDIEKTEYKPSTASTLSFTALIVSLLLVLQFLSTGAKDIPIIIAFSIVAVISAFILWRSLYHSEQQPILNVKVLKNREFKIILLTLSLSMMVVSATNYLIVYYLQISWGLDQLMMSIMMLLVPLAGIPCSIVVGKWCDRMGCKMPTVLALGLRLVFCVIFAIINPEWGLLSMAIGIVITGMSYGTSGSAQFTRAIHHCEPEYRVDGSSIVNIFNQLSMAFGLIFYMLIFSIFGMDIINIDVSVITAEEMTECFQFAAVIGIIISIITLILALIVRNIVPEKESETDPESAE